jgi:hypothetical protein
MQAAPLPQPGQGLDLQYRARQTTDSRIGSGRSVEGQRIAEKRCALAPRRAIAGHGKEAPLRAPLR